MPNVPPELQPYVEEETPDVDLDRWGGYDDEGLLTDDDLAARRARRDRRHKRERIQAWVVLVGIVAVIGVLIVAGFAAAATLAVLVMVLAWVTVSGT